MSKLPVVSARETIKALKKIGFEVDRQEGSHIILRQFIPPFRRLTVPNHKELKPGMIRGIIHQAGLSIEEFIDLL